MKLFLVLTIIIAGFYSEKALSQIMPEDSSVNIVAFWDKKDKEEYRFVKKDIKLNGEDTVSFNESVQKIIFTVLDSTEDKYKIMLTYCSLDPNSKTESFIEPTIFTKGARIIYTTNSFGEFIEINNLAEIVNYTKTLLQTLRDSTVNNFKKSNNMAKTDSLNLILEKTAAFALSNNFIQNALIKEIMLFHWFYGIKIKENAFIETDLETNTPFSLTPLNSHVTLQLDTIDYENDYYSISHTEVFDAEEMKKLGLDVLLKLAPEYKDKIQEAQTDNSELESYLVNYKNSVVHNSGWLLSTYFESNTVTNNDTKIEIRTLEYIEHEE